MIHYSLACHRGHVFDGWFGSEADYLDQKERALLTCPTCESAQVDRTLMAPKVSTGRDREAARAQMGREMRQALRTLHDKVTANAENVGPRFAQEARSMHYGEKKSRCIYGEATKDDVKGLVEEGVPIAPLPPRPEDGN